MKKFQKKRIPSLKRARMKPKKDTPERQEQRKWHLAKRLEPSKRKYD